MSRLIEGRVAQILSENLLIINVGMAAGVKAGVAVAVLAQGDEVKDPDTGEALGRWELPKGYVRATHVQERLATCEGYAPHPRAEQEDPSTNVLSAAMITHSMRPETWRSTSSAQLRVNRSQVAGIPAISPISVGDIVREMPGQPAAQPQPEQPAAEPETPSATPPAEKAGEKAP